MTMLETEPQPLVAAPAPRPLHPMDSSRLLLSLLDLAHDSAEACAAYDEHFVQWAAPPSTLRRLVSALVYRDEATMLHSRRVALLAVGMAKHLGWDEASTGKLEVAALLHDLGKLGIPDHILYKPGRLNPEEQEFVLRHHYIGVDLLQACRLDREIVEIVWSAHTHGRLAGDDGSQARGCVSQGARLLAVADAYDSLRNDQSYRKGKSHDETMRLLTEHSGKEYDRNIVNTLNRWIREEGQTFLADEAGRRLADTLTGAVDSDTVRQAGELSHVFAFLYQLETLYDGFCLVDDQLRFVVWNHGMERLTGLSAQQILGEHWERRMLAFQSEKHQPLSDRECPLQRCLSTGVTLVQSLLVEHRRMGQSHEAELQAVPLTSSDGQTRGAALLFRDTKSRRDSGQYRELQMAARRDPLTGVGNRGELEGRLARMFLARNEKRSEAPFAVIFLDLDHFKSINDTHGHAIGDRVLVNLTRLVADELYSGETICRYGGEEFVVLCPETDLATAIQRAERLRIALTSTELAAPLQLAVSASFGVAQMEDGDTLEQLLHRADEALYDAKRGGRNRTCFKSNDPKLKPAKAAQEPEAEAKAQPFVHTSQFRARIAADMISRKLAGFIDDCGADLKTVKPNQVDMHLGRPALFGRWGKSMDRQPVRIVLDIGEPHRHGTFSAEVALITATVTPLGRVGREEVFQARAIVVLQKLRAYFGVE
jgi:diguanylate cyclase (GGDEF)-like protein/putative nucleotidyltransferase with HDIG domain/PAS domain S-box-containing protein